MQYVDGFINVLKFNWNDLYKPVTSRMSPWIDIFRIVMRRSKSQNIIVIDQIIKERRTTFKEDVKAEEDAEEDANAKAGKDGDENKEEED